MNHDEVKNSVQETYRSLLAAYDHVPRYGQRLMIAEIVNSLKPLFDETEARSPIVTIEAGTGTGKTLAYIVSIIPIAKALKLKVIISTATVALQEQIVIKDLPDILKGSDLDFSYALAKGRARYLCLSKLDLMLKSDESRNALSDLYGEETVEFEGAPIYEQMSEALISGNWDGDRDSWSTNLDNSVWSSVTIDSGQCVGPKCTHFRDCCFFQARDGLDQVDCVVSNHDLVLSDLALGGGAILPPPEDCIYVFDEAHHLPIKSNKHFAYSTRIKSAIEWLERSEKLTETVRADEGFDVGTGAQVSKVVFSLKRDLDYIWPLLLKYVEGPSVGSSFNESPYVFELGMVPDELRDLSQNLAILFKRFSDALCSYVDAVKENLEPSKPRSVQDQAELWFPLLNSIKLRADASYELWKGFSTKDKLDVAPKARWLSAVDGATFADIEMSISPVSAADDLTDKLWSKCKAAILTSATLSDLGAFSMLKMRGGTPPDGKYLSIPSPFDFANVGVLEIPRLRCEPSNTELHSEIISKAIPKLISGPGGALMLFQSRRQMEDVILKMSSDWREKILCQDDFQKSQLLAFHRKQVDEGKCSLIFGLASFAEGIDLPGNYCKHVLIAKIPFSVPNDPIESTLSKWIELNGFNPFMTLSVPDATFRLLQASGRLLRNEADAGRITIFDERLVTKRYGKLMLDALPPYKRELFLRSFSVV
tara:strand:+ start:632 stop:2755 length:2124 start_codon:yes stop_codon:yes gene_type:complete